ncbi:MAG: protein kinase [Polyangiaceae bacterium]|nr:protein kinase [Polyangiaceae bacterium]
MTSSADEGAAALAGTPYRFIASLGQGGMGTVLEAEHAGLAQRVVVKLLRAELAARADLVDRLRIEAQALARLSHPNLVKVTDFGTNAAGRAYLVMERLEGRSLAEELSRRRPIPVGEALGLLTQALAGLHAAHQAGLVHRDVKPENLFLCRDGTLKVLDFGVAKVLDEAALSGLVRPRFSTHEGGMVGTPHFAAPEQLEGGLVSAATDVYAAGLVLYELITGVHPFAKHKTADAIYHAQLVEMPPPPSRLAPQAVPQELDRAILRAVAKRPGDRFQSAAELALALAGASSADSRGAPTLASAAEPAPPTLASPVASESVPTLIAARTSDAAPTVALGPVPTVSAAPSPSAVPTVSAAPSPSALPTVSAAPLPRAVPSEGLGVLCLVAGVVTGLWKLASTFFALPELWDPVAFVESVRGKVPAAAEQDVAFLSRAAALATILDSLLLMGVGAAFVVLGVVLMKKSRQGPALAVRVSHGALAVVGLCTLLNVALILPLRGALLDHVPDLPGAVPGLSELGLAFGVALVIGLSALEIGFLIAVRAWAKRLMLSNPT